MAAPNHNGQLDNYSSLEVSNKQTLEEERNQLEKRNYLGAQQVDNNATRLSKKASRPPGIQLFGYCFTFKNATRRENVHKISVVLLTYLAYTASHMARRPMTTVKNVWHHNQTSSETNNSKFVKIISSNKTLTEDWAPFDNADTYEKLYGYLDGALLGSYAVSMFFAGPMSDRMNLRRVLSVSTLLGGFCLIAMGLTKVYQIHSFAYYFVMQVLCGSCLSFAWPIVVSCIANWFGHSSSKGFLFGVWNSHTNLGNIVGSTVAGVFVDIDWSLSFIVPGILMGITASTLWLFLAPSPLDVGIHIAPSNSSEAPIITDRRESQLSRSSLGSVSQVAAERNASFMTNDSIAIQTSTLETNNNQLNSITTNGDDEEEIVVLSFYQALLLPGVLEYSLCLFFTKLVNYTFIFWLPIYISQTSNESAKNSSFLSVPFDIGAILGGAIAGLACDKLGLSALPCQAMLFASAGAMLLYQQYGTVSTQANVILQLLVGLLVNGPYCLITTSISANLGEQSENSSELDTEGSKNHKGKSLLTVVAIIDGFGSLGAFLGPTLLPFLKPMGWKFVFFTLILMVLLALVSLFWQSKKELIKLLKHVENKQ